MGNGCYVAYGFHLKSKRTQLTNRRFASDSRAFHEDMDFAEATVHGFLHYSFRNSLSGKGGRFFRPSELMRA